MSLTNSCSCGGGGGTAATTFLALTDTPSSYAGMAGMFTRVNATETGLEFSPVTPVVPVQLAAPATPVAGDLWYATGFGQLMVFDGTFWAAA